MIVPRIGDLWEFRTSESGRYTTQKRIADILWKPSRVTGRICPWIKWSHTPKARYIGDIRVKYFLKERAVRLIDRKEKR